MFQNMDNRKVGGFGQQNYRSRRQAKSPNKDPTIKPSQLPQTKTDTRTKAAKSKIMLDLSTQASGSKVNIDGKEVPKKIKATPILSKIPCETMRTRLRAFEAIDSGRVTTLNEIHQQLGVSCHLATVWIHKRDMIEKEATEDKSMRKMRSVNNFPVELQLANYCKQLVEHKLDITKEILLKAAHKIAERLGLENFVASPLWLKCFMIRNAITEVKEKEVSKGDKNNKLDAER